MDTVPAILEFIVTAKVKKVTQAHMQRKEGLAQEEPGGMLTIKERAKRGTSEESEEPE